MKKHGILFIAIIALTCAFFQSCDNSEDQKPLILAVLETNDVSQIGYTTAITGGMIYRDNGLPVTVRGVCWSLRADPTVADSVTTDASGTGIYTSTLRNLIPDTTYYVRAYATNSDGTAYGQTVTFRTLTPTVPVIAIKTSTPKNTSIEIEGAITKSGGYEIQAKGICWSESPNATKENHVVEITGSTFTGEIPGLKSGDTYYVRVWATNQVGTGYGAEKTITTSIADLSGNTYHAVKIGTQVWMLENLKTKKYRDGTVVPNVTNDTWTNLTTGAWCDFTNTAAYGNKYGHLYNWYAVNDSRNLAPLGWHVATDQEWTTLTDFLGGDAVAGGKLKETGTTNWQSPNTGATNESGFTAQSGGWYYIFSFNMGADAAWWTATPTEGTDNAWDRFVYYNYTNVARHSEGKKIGFAVRCVRDN